MLIRISLILAIVAALAAGTLNFLQVQDKIKALSSQRDDERSQKQTAQQDASSTHAKLNQTVTLLNQTKQDLSDANSKREAAEQAEAVAIQNAETMSKQLTDTQNTLKDTQDKLGAYETTGVPASDVAKLNSRLKEEQTALDIANQENLVLMRANARLTNELAKYQPLSPDILLPADLKGKVLVVDPKWDFVVLNVGDDQGVIQDGQLLVSRDGKLVAKVIVRSTDKDHCIANVMPGWKLGPVIEGDIVTPAHPAPSS